METFFLLFSKSKICTFRKGQIKTQVILTSVILSSTTFNRIFPSFLMENISVYNINDIYKYDYSVVSLEIIQSVPSLQYRTCVDISAYIHTDRQTCILTAHFSTPRPKTSTTIPQYHSQPLWEKKSHLAIFYWWWFVWGTEKHQSFKSWMISRAFSWAWNSSWCTRLHLWGERVACGPGAASLALSLALPGPSSWHLRLKRAEGQRGWCAVMERDTHAWPNTCRLSCLPTAFCFVLSCLHLGFLAVIWELKKKLGIGKRKGW